MALLILSSKIVDWCNIHTLTHHTLIMVVHMSKVNYPQVIVCMCACVCMCLGGCACAHLFIVYAKLQAKKAEVVVGKNVITVNEMN